MQKRLFGQYRRPPHPAGVFSVDEMLSSEHYGATQHFNIWMLIEKETMTSKSLQSGEKEASDCLIENFPRVLQTVVLTATQIQSAPSH